MSGIEKVCEYSGQYPSEHRDMYSYKRCSIQILPEYRKLFKNSNSTLLIFKSSITRYLCLQYYALITDDPKLQGNVGGFYLNWIYPSSSISTVYRKLRRMVGSKLRIVKIDQTYEEFMQPLGKLPSLESQKLHAQTYIKFQ